MANPVKQTRCLFCSLCCPVAVELPAGDAPLTEFADGAPLTQGRLCYRGHFVSELLAHPQRLTSAAVRNGQALHPCAQQDALAQVAQRLRSARPGDIMVLIDGNLPCEDIVAGLSFARDALPGCRSAVYLPANDEATLAGLADVRPPMADPAELEGSDFVLVTGDPFASHPTIARSVLDAKGAARGHKLIVVDGIRGRTARFAQPFIQTRVGGQLAAVAAIAASAGVDVSDVVDTGDVSRMAEAAGVSLSDIRAAAALTEAESPVIILSLPVGSGADARRIAGLAARMAQKKGSLLPLMTYGNAAGAYRLARAHGALSTAEAVAAIRDGRVRCLLNVGAPLAEAVPATWMQAALSRLEFVASAGPMPSAMDSYADVTLPIGCWFESDGTVVDGVGQQSALSELLPPPRGACRARDLFEQLGRRIANVAINTAVADVPALASGQGTLQPVAITADDSADGMLVTIRADGTGFADGGITRRCAWPRAMEACPAVRLNPADAAAISVETKDVIRVATEHGSAEVRAFVTADVPAGVAALSPNFPQCLALLGCEVDEENRSIEFTPVHATLNAGEGAPTEKEEIRAGNQ